MFHIPILMFTWDVEVTLMGRSFWRDSNFFSSSVETSLIRPERAWGDTKSWFTLKRKDKESAPYGKDGITNLMMRNWMMSWWPRLGLSSFPILMRVDLDRRRLQVEHALAGTLLNSLHIDPLTWLLGFVLMLPIADATSESVFILSRDRPESFSCFLLLWSHPIITLISCSQIS